MESAPAPCPHCNHLNPDWVQTCLHCDAAVSHPLRAAQSELGHIEYLLYQMPGWKRLGLLTNLAELRLRQDYQGRQRQLFAELQAGTASPVTSIFPMDLPPLREAAGGHTGSVPKAGAFPVPGVASPPSASSHTPISVPPNAPPFTPPPPRPPTGEGLRRFFQQHALQIVFALATVLVLAALRSMLGWDWIGDVAMRLLPGVPLALTLMFWTFGQKTRAENPWAAFTYHGLAASMTAFDILIVNKYWLPVPLSAKPVLLLASLAATGVAGGLLRRWREIPYLHLLHLGGLTTLYSLLQMFRPQVPPIPKGDFRPSPLWMFGAAYMLYAFGCLLMARQAGKATENAENKAANTQDNAVPAANQPRSVGAFGQSWQLAWTFWSHASVLGVALVAALNLALQDANLHDFALLALLAGLVYTSGAQLLQEARMVRLSSGFLLTGGLLWLLADHSRRFWAGSDLLLLILSAFSLVLATYNTRTAATAQGGTSNALATAYRQNARAGVALATVLAWGYALYVLPQYEWFDVLADAPTGALLTGLCGLFYLGFARSEQKPAFLYAALSTWGLTLLNGLQIARAPLGMHALSLTLYGGLLMVMPVLAAKRGIVVTPWRPVPDDGKATAEASPPAQGDVWWAQPCHLSGNALATLGILLAAFLPAGHGLPLVWLWTTGTLTLGFALYILAAQRLESEGYAYAALACAAYVSMLLMWRLLPISGFPWAGYLAPFLLATTGASFLLAWRAGNLTHKEAFWQTPIAWAGLVALLASLTDGLLAFGMGNGALHYVVALGPCVLSGMMLTASRRAEMTDETDALRHSSFAVVAVAAGVELALWCGLTQGVPNWHAPLIRNWAYGLLLFGAIWQGAAHGLRALGDRDVWSRHANVAGLTTAFVSAVLLTVSGMWAGGKTGNILLFDLALAGAFALFARETYRTKEDLLWRPMGALITLAALANIGNVSISLPFAAPGGTLLALGMAATFLWLAKPTESLPFARLSVVPLALGYSVYTAWETVATAHPTDILLSRGLWVAGGLGMAFAYLKTARRTECNAFTYVAATLLTACYLRTVTHFGPVGAQWHALCLLPFLVTLYVLGARAMHAANLEDHESTENLIGQPFRRAALVFSGLALAWSTGTGEEWVAAHGLRLETVTLTLIAYGLAYGVLALYRRTSQTAALGSLTLTAAYLHYLLVLTGWQGAPPLLSLPHFAFYASQAGVFWLIVGWRVRRQYDKANLTDLANPLLKLAGTVALGSALIGFVTVQTKGEGMWSVLTLAWTGAVWFGLWALEEAEICLHIATWNLLIAWGIILYDRVGANVQFLDLYLLPVGLYLLTLGHMASRRSKLQQAHGLWWAGLLLTITPAFLAYWEQAGDRHTILFIAECLFAVLWGIGQRIRAFVCAGMGFIALFAAAISIGHLPDVWGTLTTLLIGVALFVIGFYALTHRDVVQRWTAALESHWQGWLAWK